MTFLTPWRYLRAVLLLPWAGVCALGRGIRAVFLSARAWAILLVVFIAVLVLYYAMANRYTPFTTDAFAQAYVVQVAAQVDGQVVHVYVQENQTVKKGEL